MKIKEVAKLTGLTEKTIRYYEEKQLINPSKRVINGRIFRSYSNKNIETLSIITNLRKLDFAIADIIIMRDDPKRIPEILKEYYAKNADDLNFKTNVISQLELINYDLVKNIEDLASLFKDMAGNRPLPAADIEMQFYKIDGLTKEERDREVHNYGQQLAFNYKKKMKKTNRNIVIFFIVTLLISTVLAVLVWKNTYYLGYIHSYTDDLGWRNSLLPLFALMVGVIIYVFVKIIRRPPKQSEENIEFLNLSIARYSIFLFVLSLVIGIIVQVQSIKSLDNLQRNVGNTVRQEWYELYRMTDYVDKYFADPETFQEDISFKLYVNQTCYNFPYNHFDSLHTKMYDLLIWCYDKIFKELTSSRTEPKDKEKLKYLLMELNVELQELSMNIIYRPYDELADLTRHDSSEALKLRKDINNFVDKYYEQTESLFWEINK